MKRKELKALLWNVIGPIDIPSDVKKLYTQPALRLSNHHERRQIVKTVFFPNRQEKLFFSENENDKQLALALALDLLDSIIRTETDPVVLQYFSKLRDVFNPEVAMSSSQSSFRIEEMKDTEHDMLCRLIQIYLTNETMPVFKRVITVIFLFSDYFGDLQLLDTIFCYYDIYKLKIM